MFKLMIKIIKKVIFSSFLLYGYNLIAVSLEIIIPINLITVGIISLLGVPSLLSLILIKILIF